jgi:hypothetical protein
VTRCCATDRWGWVATGPGGQRGGAGGRGVSEAGRRRVGPAGIVPDSRGSNSVLSRFKIFKRFK